MNDLRAPDGSPVEVFSTFPAGNAPGYIGARLDPGSTVLDLGCGAGRLARELAAAGHRVTGVDIAEEMIAALRDAASDPARKPASVGEAAPALALAGIVGDIDGLELHRTFDAVVLASYLVNVPDPGRCQRYLAACRRHVRDGGRVFVQRHHPDFLAHTDVVESTEDGYGYRYQRLGSVGATVTARMTYLHDGREWHQDFETVILDDAELVDALAEAGLRFAGWLDEFATWAEAVAEPARSVRGGGHDTGATDEGVNE